MFLHAEPLRYDKANLIYAYTAVKFCDEYREGDIYNEFYKLCQRDEPWLNRILNSPTNERYANISMAASRSLIERLAICYYSQYKDFNLRLFHTYFWHNTLDAFRLNQHCDFNIGMSFFEVACVNFNLIPLLSSYSKDNIYGIIKLMTLRVYEITIKKTEHFPSLFTNYEIGLKRACDQIYERIRNEPTDTEEAVFFSKDNIYDLYKGSYEFIDQHLPELINTELSNEPPRKFRPTYYNPTTNHVD